MRRYLPSLSALHAFEAAARYMNFTRAADDLGLTQSGISRQIRNLEEFLGATLFHRSGPRLVLTETGANYYRNLALTLDRLEEISIDAVRGRSVDSSLIIGTHPTLASRWLPERLGSFIGSYPDIPLEIMPAMPSTDFETTRLDVAILRGAGTWLHGRSIELFPELLAVVASPALIPPGSKLDPLQFAEFPLLQNAGRPSLWLNWLRTRETLIQWPHPGNALCPSRNDYQRRDPRPRPCRRADLLHPARDREWPASHALWRAGAVG